MLMKVGSRTSVPGPSRPVSRGNLRPVPMDLDATLPLGQAARLRPEPELLPMRCLRCQGQVQKGTAPVRLEREGYSLTWQQVPAWVCTRCDLAYFEPEAVETVRKAVTAMKTAKPAHGH